MYDYGIAVSSLGYRIIRQNNGRLDFLDVNGGWNRDESCSRLFYNEDEAKSAFIIVRRCGSLEGKIRGGVKKTKASNTTVQSWGDLSNSNVG